jgi:hypothetical protein
MSTKILVPRASGEGGIGSHDNAWGQAYFDTGNFNKGLYVSGQSIGAIAGGLGGKWEDATIAGDIYYTGGNVGIGTTSPGAKLEINGTAMINPTLTAGNNGGLWFGKNNTVQGYIGGGDYAVNAINDTDFGISAATDGDLVFGTTTSSGGTDHERMRITSIGNVGIGTTSPLSKLDVRGDIILDSNGLTNREIYLRNQNTDSVGGKIASDQNLSLWAGDSSGIPSQYLTLKIGGNVGIGITSPDYKLDVEASNNGAYAARIHNVGGDSYGLLVKTSSGATEAFPILDLENTAGNVFRVQANGNVGIGTTNPSAPLEISSTTGGVIMPRMSTVDMNSIANPTDGEMIYNTTANKFYGRANNSWVALH